MKSKKEQLQELVDRAPQQVRGRAPTPEEMDKLQTYKVQVKALIEQLPPGDSGITYKGIMRALNTKEKVGLVLDLERFNISEQASDSACIDIPSIRQQARCRSISKQGRNEKSGEALDYLCVLDFEATCNEDGPVPIPQEIIEFPVLLLNIKTGRVEDTFHHYVRPDVHPRLSPFCTSLTGITQDVVDGGICLTAALARHREWLDRHGLVNAGNHCADGGAPSDGRAAAPTRFLYVTAGNWDLQTCLPNQLAHHGWDDDVSGGPFGPGSWINIVKPYRTLYGKKSRRSRSMTAMLDDMGLALEGRLHSGIDDCRNIARICACMLEDGWQPEATTVT